MKVQRNVRGMNGASGDFSGIPRFPVYPAKLLPHVCGDRHKDFLGYYWQYEKAENKSNVHLQKTVEIN